MHMVNLEGAQRGELQYALEKTTPVLASSSRFGVLMTESGLFILRSGAAIWSAIMYKILGFFGASVPALLAAKFLAFSKSVCEVMKCSPSN